MSKGLYGWTGQMLRVDLSSGKISKESSEELVKKFIGGIGLGAKLMWDEISPETHPFDPENKLLLLNGPLTGTLAPTSGRMEVCTKAPGNDPAACTRSGIGGSFGPELKYAGYDALIVQGKAEKPVLIVIKDGDVKIKDARNLWGKDTYDTQKEICSEHGRNFKTVCIGPAGENLLTCSAIMSGSGYAAAKTGMGAVMGSKNLKAISVVGTGRVEIARKDEFIDICMNTRKLLINHPVKKWTTQGPVDVSVRFADTYRTKHNSCFGCPIGCRSWIEFPGMDPGEMMCLASFYLWVGAEDNDAWHGKVITDKIGICQYTVYDMIRWLNECYKAGVITEEGTGIPWSKFGTSDFIDIFLDVIVNRKGFGDVLANGASKAAAQLGDEAVELYKSFFPARNQSQHYSIRAYPEVLMQWATDSRDPLSDAHDWICLAYWAGTYWPRDQKGALNPEQLKARAKEAWGTEKAVDSFTYEDKAQTAIIVQNMSRLKNSLVLCDWSVFPINSSPNGKDYKGDPDAERKLYCAATGEDVDKQEWLKIGERLFNMERAIMAREGRRKENDTVEDYYFRVPESEVAAWELKRDPLPVADYDKFVRMRDEYYTLRGANLDTGIPSREKLEELDLKDVADQLSEDGLI